MTTCRVVCTQEIDQLVHSTILNTWHLCYDVELVCVIDTDTVNVELMHSQRINKLEDSEKLDRTLESSPEISSHFADRDQAWKETEKSAFGQHRMRRSWARVVVSKRARQHRDQMRSRGASDYE